MKVSAYDDRPTVYAEADEHCSLCEEPVEDGCRYYQTPCGHLICFTCMEENFSLNRCPSCRVSFVASAPVRVRTKKDVIDLTD